MKKNINNIILFLFFLFTLSFITVGYAYYTKLLNVSGIVTVPDYGEIVITEVSMIDSVSVTENTPASINGVMLNFDLNISGQTGEYYIIYSITISNNSVVDFVYIQTNISPTIVSMSGNNTATSEVEVTGIEDGDVIASGESIVVQLKLKFFPSDPNDTYTATGNTQVDTSANQNGSLLGSITSSTTGDLTGGNTVTSFTLNVINSYSTNKTFTIAIANSNNFVICDSNGLANINFNINANSQSDYTFYIKKKDGAAFPNNTETLSLTLKSNGVPNCSLGNVTISVDPTVVNDTEAPIISNVTASQDATVGNVTVAWTAQDDSTITGFTIYVYNSSGSLKQTLNTNGATSIVVNNLTDGTYYFTVVGTDTLGNTATSQEISAATTSPGHASKSSNLTCKWIYTVNTSGLQNMSSNGPSTATKGTTYTTTLTAANNYALPDTITVVMNGLTLSSPGGYSYNQNNGSLSIYNVNGNISISGSATNSCLAKGTLIKTYNGYKKIENINYDDLLEVYDHVRGVFTYSYPIWIEEAQETNRYTLVSFSDNSNLKVVGSHSVFDVDKKRYVEVNNELKINDRVYKYNNGKLDVTVVKEIKEVYENTSYYNIVSTYYYNVIANNLLTTDSTSSISNIYGFKDNAIYAENFYNICNGPKLEYKNVKMIPHYLYKGLNLQNALPLVDNGFDYNFLKSFLEKQTKKPIQIKGNNYWIFNVNGKASLVKEGSVQKVPFAFGKYKYYDTSSNTYYYSGEKIKINHSVYLENAN